MGEWERSRDSTAENIRPTNKDILELLDKLINGDKRDILIVDGLPQ